MSLYRCDEIGKVVVEDPIILEYGSQLLQTSNNVKKRTVVARNKMRECARILVEFRRNGSVDSIATIIGEFISRLASRLTSQ